MVGLTIEDTGKFSIVERVSSILSILARVAVSEEMVSADDLAGDINDVSSSFDSEISA